MLIQKLKLNITHKSVQYVFVYLQKLNIQLHYLGIRFRMIGSRLNLEIMATPFNFTSGLLSEAEKNSFWYSNDITER